MRLSGRTRCPLYFLAAQAACQPLSLTFCFFSALPFFFEPPLKFSILERVARCFWGMLSIQQQMKKTGWNWARCVYWCTSMLFWDLLLRDTFSYQIFYLIMYMLPFYTKCWSSILNKVHTKYLRAVSTKLECIRKVSHWSPDVSGVWMSHTLRFYA